MVGRIASAMRVVVAARHRRALDAVAVQRLVQELAGAAIGVVGDDHVRAARQHREERRRDRGHAAREQQAVLGAFERGELLLGDALRRVAVAAVLLALDAALEVVAQLLRVGERVGRRLHDRRRRARCRASAAARRRAPRRARTRRRPASPSATGRDRAAPPRRGPAPSVMTPAAARARRGARSCPATCLGVRRQLDGQVLVRSAGSPAACPGGRPSSGRRT